jgi:branched-chain amino acid transport system substrate-binding protein
MRSWPPLGYLLAAPLGIALAVLLAACQVPGQIGSQANESRIATVGPMSRSGDYAMFGEQMKHGAEMAVRDINVRGGVNGKRLLLEVGDDRCEPKRAVTVANQLMSQGVRFVAGHFCSGSSIPASQVYQERGALMISPASSNPQLTEQGFRNVFRVVGRDDDQGTFAADYVVANKLGEKIAIVHDSSQYGRLLAGTFKRQLNGRGVREVMNDSIMQDENDLSALVSKMRSTGVDLIYFGGYHAKAGLLVRQAREQGLTAQLVSGDALVDRRFWEVAGTAGEGTLMTFLPDPRRNPAAAEVVQRFKAEGYDPEGYTLHTYAAVQAFAEAANRAGSAEPAAVGEALRAGTVQTVLGPLSFDTKGDVSRPTQAMYRWRNGQYEEIGS